VLSGDNISQASLSYTHGTYDNESIVLRAYVSETACKPKTREKKLSLLLILYSLSGSRFKTVFPELRISP
jgi:hypothetical protein